MFTKRFIILAVLSAMSFGLIDLASAEDSADIWSVVTVLGTKEDEAALPGSGDSVTTDDIRIHSYDDINRVLRKIPGVYLREEDGYGLFPNLSLRGVDTNRSSKVTIMEDGIVAAPAPYSSPSAYYSPTAGRMSEIEVLKGSSQVKYGPHTTGGVINYLSTPIPEDRRIYLKGILGNEDEVRIHGYLGDKVKTEYGKFGYVVEQYYRENDGFKTIDTTPDFPDGSDTGFTKKEPMFKMSWETNEDADRYQKIEAKVGYTDLIANETYLGLTESDFDNDPYRRYSASRFDKIDTEQTRTYLRYITDITDATSLKLTGYYNKFQRNWSKLHSISGGSESNLSEAIAAAGTSLSILQGTAAGTLNVRNNNRSYEQYGYQGALNFEFPIGEFENDLEIGLGYHMDYIRRLQNTISYTQAANGTITDSVLSAPGTAGNRRQESDAFSAFIKDTVTIGDLTLTPGFRWETIDYEYIDFETSGTSPADTISRTGESNLDAIAGGIGANYNITDEVSTFVGVHQGFSVPGPRENARSGIKEETSLTKEVGIRFNDDQKVFETELTYFHTDFDDLLVADNIGGAGTGVTENVGEVISQGIELKAQYDLARANDKEYSNPYYVSFTYTNAELDGDSNSTDSESIFAGGVDGNKVPYIPEIQFTVGTGLEFDNWGVFVDGTFVEETYSTASNVDSQIRPDGTPDARFGKTDDYFVVDISGYYDINEHTKLVANLHNVTDQEYIVSRHPHGPRPGKPFTVTGGLEIVF